MSPLTLLEIGFRCDGSGGGGGGSCGCTSTATKEICFTALRLTQIPVCLIFCTSL